MKKKEDAKPEPPCPRENKEVKPIQELMCSHGFEVLLVLDSLGTLLDRLKALEVPELDLLRASLRWSGDDEQKVKTYIEQHGPDLNDVRFAFMEAMYVYIKKQKLKPETELKGKSIEDVLQLISMLKDLGTEKKLNS